MTTNAKFEKWWSDKQHMLVGTVDAQEIWQAALSSIEVTPELVEVGFSATDPKSHCTRRNISDALQAVFAAIKDGQSMTTQPPDLKKLAEALERLRRVAAIGGSSPYATVLADDLRDLLDAYEARARDAELWRYVVRENNKGLHGRFRIVWFDQHDDICTMDGVSVDGKDENAIVRYVDAIRHATQGD